MEFYFILFFSYKFSNSITPLHFAVRARNIAVLKLLYQHKELEKFDRLERPGPDFVSSTDLAREYGFKEIEEFLLEFDPKEEDKEIARIPMKVDIHDFYDFEFHSS